MTILVAGNAALLDLVGVTDHHPDRSRPDSTRSDRARAASLLGGPAARAEWTQGGAGLIAALRIARQGHAVRLWHPVPGDHRATAMFAELANAGVDTGLCPRTDQPMPCSVIVSDPSARLVWASRNAVAELGDPDALLAGVTQVIFAPVWDGWADLLLQAAKARGISCSIFGATPPDIPGQHWHMVVLNAAQMAAAAPFNATLTCVTRGAAGAVAISGSQEVFIPPKAGTIIDTTGVGEAFAAIFMAAILQGKTAADAGREASIAASQACGHWGAWPVEPQRSAVLPGADRLDRILGALSGAASGETLGTINSFVWMPVWRKDIELGSRGDDAAGCASDDARQAPETEMTREGVANSLNDWFMSMGSSDPLAAGPGTRRALETRDQGEAIDVIGGAGAADSAAMRLAPIGVFAGLANLDIGQTTDLVEAACWPVHVTSRAISGATAVAWAIAVAVRGDAWDDIMQAALTGAGAGAVRGIKVDGEDLVARIAAARALAAASTSVQTLAEGIPKLPGADGPCANLIPGAIAIADFVQGNPARAIEIGGSLHADPDAITAIAAAICGAYAGTNCLPVDWRPLIDRNAPISLLKWAQSLEDLARAHVSD